MNIILTIIIGGIIGWLAGLVFGRDEGMIASVVIGIVGSLIGGFLSAALTGINQSYATLSWAGLLWSFLGAVILVAILTTIQRRKHSPHTRV